MNDGSDFTRLVPGFDFLQSLAKTAGAAMPGIGQWVAPTLDPAELDKRIGELRTVQFWLEQNARLLATTIQALEVQRMTLSTLKTMNVQMGDLRESLKIKPLAGTASGSASAAPAEPAAKKGSAAAAGNAVDPMQWWGALTQQFTQLATSAMKDGAADAAKALGGGLMKPARSAEAGGSGAGAEGAAGASKPAAKKRAAGSRRAPAAKG
jgi:hypothetical protein